MLDFYSNTLKTGNCRIDRRFLNKSSPGINWYHDGTNPLTINTGPNKPFPKTQSKWLAFDKILKRRHREHYKNCPLCVFCILVLSHNFVWYLYSVFFSGIFSCPGSSLPDLGHWVSHWEKTKRQQAKKAKRQKYKEQKESLILWRQGSFALLRCFIFKRNHESWFMTILRQNVTFTF